MDGADAGDNDDDDQMMQILFTYASLSRWALL
jgi:hypothetical protein